MADSDRRVDPAPPDTVRFHECPECGRVIWPSRFVPETHKGRTGKRCPNTEWRVVTYVRQDGA